jgi:MFS family permease
LGGSIGLMVAGMIIPLVSATWGWRSNFLLLALIGAAWLLFWLPLGREGAVDDQASSATGARKPYALLCTDPTLLTCILMHFASYWSIALTVTWTTVYLQKGLGYDALTAGRMFSLYIAISLAMAMISAWLSQRLMQRNVSSRVARGILTAIAAIFAGGCFASLILPGIPPILRVLLLGIGGGLSQTILYTGPPMIGEITPFFQRGSILAVDNSVASLAGILAPIVTGYFIQYTGGGPASGYEAAFALTGVLIAVTGVAGLVFLQPLNSANRNLGGFAMNANSGR